MPKPHTDRERRSLDEIIILKRNQTGIFINLIYFIYLALRHVTIKIISRGSPVPGNSKHFSWKYFSAAICFSRDDFRELNNRKQNSKKIIKSCLQKNCHFE